MNNVYVIKIGNLGLKLLCVFDAESELCHKIIGFFKYNVNLGTNDKSFKVRDRMRLIKFLVFEN